MNNIMPDIETLGNHANSVVISIGAVAFDETTGQLGQEFYQEINIDSCLDAGLEVNGSTIAWWMSQSDAARKVLSDRVKHDDSLPLVTVLTLFTTYINQVSSKGKVKIWGNGSSFDNSILEECYRKVGSDAPWMFWNDRCYRTVKNLYKDVKADKRQGVYHNALDDAKHQARHLMKICQAKRLKL